MPKTYKAARYYTFECTREIKANSQRQADEYADKHCGCISPDYHSSLPYKDVTRTGDIHPSVSSEGQSI